MVNRVNYGELAPVATENDVLQAREQHREDPTGHERSAGARGHIVHHHVFAQRQLLGPRLPCGTTHASRLRGAERRREGLAGRRISLEGTVGGVEGASNLVNFAPVLDEQTDIWRCFEEYTR